MPVFWVFGRNLSFNISVEFIFKNSSWYDCFAHSVVGSTVNWIYELSFACYNRSLLLKRNFYFAWQIYTTKQVACFSISLRNQRQMDQTFIFWEKKSFTRSSLWLINYRVHNLPLQNCQHFPSFPMKWCSLPFIVRKKSKNVLCYFSTFL